MNLTLNKSTDKNTLSLIWGISLTFALAIGFFDEGFNSLRFLLEPGGLFTILLIASVIATIPTLIYFAIPSARLGKKQRMSISLIVELSIIALLASFML